MATSVEHRRRLRALEAKRDSLLESKEKATSELSKVRAEIAHVKKGK